jgi:hypothetical protein
MKPRRRAGLVALGVGVAAIAIAGLIGLAATQSPEKTGSPARRGIDLPGNCGGKIVSLREASTLVPFTILLPDHDLAREGTLTSVEWCEHSQLLVLIFESRVRVELSPSQLADPAEEFQQQAEFYSGTSVGTIRGVPALFVEPGSKDASSVEPAPGGVEFVDGKVLVDVVGDGAIPLDDLKGVTESLKPYIFAPDSR